MKKIILSILIGVFALLIFGAVNAMLIPVPDQAKENAKAPEKSPVIEETDGGKWELERVDFVHYVKPTNPGKPTKPDNCYKLMGVKWNTFPVDYIINPVNDQNLTENFITSAIFNSAETWDSETSKELFNNNYGISTSVQYGIQDYQNAIAFGDYSNSGVIAVTSVWYTRVGKKIVEFDMLFNTDFIWGDATVSSSLMDLQNITTHELGHAVGLSDIYNSSCSLVTMYGYSNYGEIQKRILEQPDILGLQKMYGI